MKISELNSIELQQQKIVENFNTTFQFRDSIRSLPSQHFFKIFWNLILCYTFNSAMKSHVYFVAAVLCFLAGLWLQEASSRCLVYCISNLVSTLYAHLITGLQTSRAEALSLNTKESVGTSVQDNIAHDSNLKLTSYPSCDRGYARYKIDRLCRKCDDGTYVEYVYAYPGDNYPFSQCTPCPAGTYAELFGAYKCTACPAGTTSPAGASSCTSSTSCAKGEYRKAGCACEKCPAGTYSDTLTASECTACPIGFSSSAGASCCTPCAKGTYSSTAGSACTSCPAGTYAGATGSSKCKKCTKGSSSSAGASSCTPCAKGYYSPKAGSICSPCCAGTYADCTGSVTCKKCPTGYTSEAGASSCKCWAKGTYSAAAWWLFSVQLIWCFPLCRPVKLFTWQLMHLRVGSFLDSAPIAIYTLLQPIIFLDKLAPLLYVATGEP